MYEPLRVCVRADLRFTSIQRLRVFPDLVLLCGCKGKIRVRFHRSDTATEHRTLRVRRHRLLTR